jgi:hypothetical protein
LFDQQDRHASISQGLQGMKSLLRHDSAAQALPSGSSIITNDGSPIKVRASAKHLLLAS